MRKWPTLVAKIGPLVLAGIPGVPIVLVPLIVEAMQAAEQIFAADGEQKKRLVLNAVANGITAVNAARGHDLVDAALVTSIIDPAIDTTVEIINAVQRAHDTTKVKANP